MREVGKVAISTSIAIFNSHGIKSLLFEFHCDVSLFSS